MFTLQWRHNEHDSVSNHQPHDCLLNRLFRRRSKKTSKLRVTGLCAGNSPGTGEFPAQMASYAKNVSIWWRHHDMFNPLCYRFVNLRIRILSPFLIYSLTARFFESAGHRYLSIFFRYVFLVSLHGFHPASKWHQLDGMDISFHCACLR